MIKNDIGERVVVLVKRGEKGQGQSEVILEIPLSMVVFTALVMPKMRCFLGASGDFEVLRAPAGGVVFMVYGRLLRKISLVVTARLCNF